jgi:DNA-directed RNA polymerase specialized sigma subunit
MSPKEYLSQAYRIDQRINSKLEQVVSLRELATKATSTLSDMPSSGTRNIHSIEGIIAKMVDLETEINKDIDTLVDLKCEIVSLIKQIQNTEYQTLLELRYLCFKTWEQIAVDLGYSLQHIFRIHDRAIKDVVIKKR